MNKKNFKKSSFTETVFYVLLLYCIGIYSTCRCSNFCARRLSTAAVSCGNDEFAMYVISSFFPYWRYYAEIWLQCLHPPGPLSRQICFFYDILFSPASDQSDVSTNLCILNWIVCWLFPLFTWIGGYSITVM